MSGVVETRQPARPAAREPWSSGMWGMLLLLAGESALFGVLIASYFYLRFDTEEWPPPGVESPPVLVPLVLLAVVVASSGAMQLASASARRRVRRTTVLWLGVALVVQASYLVTQLLLFERDLDTLSPRDSAYASSYFTLLGLHHAHVVVGILLVAFVLVRSAGGLTTYRARGVQVVALYWLVVNALAVAVTLTVASPSL